MTINKSIQRPRIHWLAIVFALSLLLPAIAAQAAGSLQYGQPAAGSLNAGAKADYSFVGKAGDKPVIAMNAHGGSMSPYIALYDPQGHLIGEDSNGGTKGDALLKGTVLPADGTYKVEVTNKAQSGSGNFSLFINEERHQVYFDGPPSTPQNGKEDYKLTSAWDHKNITYHVINTLRQFNAQDVRAVIAQAFQSWANSAPITFTEVAGQGDINIQFGQIDGALNILGETCPPANPCGPGSVTFDSDESWTLGNPQGYQGISLLGVASHEFGHAIGLLHTNDTNALMYPEYSPYNLQPGQDDIAGVQRLYGAGSGRINNPTPLPNSPPVNNQNGQMQVSGQLDNQHYAHFWDFDVQAGDVVTITMHGASGDLDSLLVLIDGQNHVIAYDDDNGGGKDAQLRNIKFIQSGTYTVAATRFAQAQGYTTGTYTLGIEYGTQSGPAIAPTTSANNVPNATGNVTVSAGQASQIASLPALDTILATPFANSAAPGTQTRTGTVVSTQSYVWGQTWCATDAKTLAANLANITFTFNANNKPVDPKLVLQSNVSGTQGLSCTEYFVILSNWAAGNVSLSATLTLKQPVFDGQTIYPPGDYVYQYNLQVSPG